MSGYQWYKIGLLSLLISGCAAGPDFNQPGADKSDRYTQSELDLNQLSSGQKISSETKLQQRWWTMFGSKTLTALVEQGLANSPTVASAEARLREAEENLNSQVGSVLFPSIDGNANSNRQKISGAGFGGRPNIYNVHNASVSASYGIDFFGASRRYLEGLESQVDFENYQLQAARITLAANIVTAAVREGSLRSQIQASEQIIQDSEMQLEMVEKQFELGVVSRSALLNQVTALAQAQSTLPELLKQLQQNRHLLNVLVGRLPADTTLPEFTMQSFQLPSELPLALPSELVRQRPDILASEALLHQASANVGVATANLYPRITLTGSFGTESNTLSGLFTTGSTVWGAGAGLVQPLFHGGELRAKKRSAEAALEKSYSNYRETVLQAFRDVADTLLALEMDGRTLQLRQQAAKAAGEVYALVNGQFETGSASYLELLNASQQFQQTTIALAQAEATRFADSAALIHAIGGCWWVPLNDEIGDEISAEVISDMNKTMENEE